MTFFYNNNERLRFIFDTPNQFGVFLNFILFFILALTIVLFCHGKKKTGVAALLLGVTPAIVLLAMTYSRGAIVGMIIGALFMSIGLKRDIRYRLIAAGSIIFTAVLLVVPDGLERVLRIFQFSDLAVVNRFILWQGGAEICADYWLTGVPVQRGYLYSALYQPITMNTFYSSFVNDYLSLGATYGLFALFAYLTIIGICIGSAYLIYIRQGNIFILGCGAAIAAYATSALFSTFYNNLILLILLILSGAYSLFSVIRYRRKINFKAVFLISCAVAGICVVSVFICGTVFAGSNSIKSKPLKVGEEMFWTIMPRYKDPDRILIYISKENNEGFDFVYDSKYLLRQLAEAGNIIFAGYDIQSPGISLQMLNSFLNRQYSNKPIVLILVGAFEQEALSALAPNISGLILIDPAESNEIPDTLNIPVLIAGHTNIHSFVSNRKVFIRNVSYVWYERTLLKELILLFLSRRVDTLSPHKINSDT